MSSSTDFTGGGLGGPRHLPQEGAHPGASGLEASSLKAELRRRILARRDALAADERDRLSAVIFAKVAALDGFRRAATLLAYHSFGSEPVTPPFLRLVLGLGKALVLPRVNREARVLELYRVTDVDADFRPGIWGIREPDPVACPRVRPEEVDFVLVPGVAFDVRGGRIGYGGGYYDRLIAECAHGPAFVAAAFEVQIVPAVPVNPDDRRVDQVVTERCSYAA